MAIEIGPVIRQDLPIPPGVTQTPVPSREIPTPERKDNIGKPSYSTLITMAEGKKFSLKHVGFQERPLEPLEPPWGVGQDAWNEYVRKRDAARAYALENDLRGTF